MKLERFACSHQIRKYQIFFEFKFSKSLKNKKDFKNPPKLNCWNLIHVEYKFCLRAQAIPDAPQLSQTFSRKNGKPSIFRMAKKYKITKSTFFGINRKSGQTWLQRCEDVLKNGSWFSANTIWWKSKKRVRTLFIINNFALHPCHIYRNNCRRYGYDINNKLSAVAQEHV